MRRNSIWQRGPLLNKLKATVLYMWNCSQCQSDGMTWGYKVIESNGIFPPQQCSSVRSLQMIYVYAPQQLSWITNRQRGYSPLFDQFYFSMAVTVSEVFIFFFLSHPLIMLYIPSINSIISIWYQRAIWTGFDLSIHLPDLPVPASKTQP